MLSSFFRRFFSYLKFYTREDKKLAASIKTIVGRKPYNLSLYHLAMRHSSVARVNKQGFKVSNERLEYLGDAVLGLIVAQLLFEKFPYKDEGFLTEMRSRIVNRESLNRLGRKFGLKDLINYNQSSRSSISHKSMYGDTMEALIGAVYLDMGYRACTKFVVDRLIANHFDLEELVNANQNYKSIVIEYAQKENKSIEFVVNETETADKTRQFVAEVIIDEEMMAQGHGLSKKKAEQDAALKTCDILNLN
ncbi:MAG: ribonuclease III [Cyclobacteriaceae bacterium]